MKVKQLIANINNILVSRGFYRKNKIWNRQSDEYVDVIDIQTSKYRDAFCVNLGISEKFVTKMCWNIDGQSFLDEPSCTVRARLGILSYGKDKWWSLDDDLEYQEISSKICDVAIPFFDINHSVNKMIEYLESLPGNKYPPESVYLPLLYYRKGERQRCMDMLRDIEEKFSGGWRQKVSDIISSLK